MDKRIKDFEIIDHGVDHAQYFQGCGVSFTDFDAAFTCCGNDAKEVYEDAVESIAMAGYDVDRLPKRPRGINKRNHVPASALKDDMNEVYYYVSIRVKE